MEPVNKRSPEPPAAKPAGAASRWAATGWVAYGLVLVLVVAFVVMKARARQAQLEQVEQDQLAYDVTVVNTLLSDKLRAMGNAIDGVRAQQFWLTSTPMSTEEVGRRLDALVGAMDGVRSILIIDRGGVGVASNRPELVGLSYTERECFQALRARPDPGALCVSRELVTPLGRYSIVVSKMLPGPAGDFDGAVACALDPVWFARLLRPLEQRAPDLRLSVVHQSGGVIGSEPASGPWSGGDAPVPVPWAQRLQGARAAGAFTGADADGRERLVAYAPLDATGAKPLVTIASRDSQVLRAPGRKDLIADLATTLLLALAGAVAWAMFEKSRALVAEDAATRLEAEREAHHRELRETEQRGLAEVVEQQVAVQTASALAHDLNQPLLAISAYSEAALNVLKRGELDPAKLHRIMDGCFQQAQRAGALMHDMSAHLSQALHVPPNPETFDLNELIRECVAEGMARRMGVAAPELRLDEALPPVTGSRVRTSRVICNLLTNADEAGRGACAGASRPAVTVTTFRAGAEAVVAVADVGAGVPAADAERIFSPLFSTKATGLGLGLSISRALAESQGGCLTLARANGEGAEFHFTIPLADSHADDLSR